MAFDSTNMRGDPTLDPIQGMDIQVSTVQSLQTAGARSGGQLVGVFTSAMFKIVNQTETYLPLNARIPRHLDGEIIIVYALEQGLIDPNVMTNTFGSTFAAALANGRGAKIPRSSRFNVKFKAELSQDLEDNDPAIFFNDQITNRSGDGLATGNLLELGFMLTNCRVDTFSFGMTSGRHIVANSWQGTAEGLKVVASSTGTTTEAAGF